MLQYTKTSETLPLALWEKIKYGQNIGLDVSKDVICPHCWHKENYTKVVIIDGEWFCPTHGQLKAVAPEYVIEENSKYHGMYETRLIERLKVMNALIPSTPNLVKQGELLRMKAIVRAKIGNDFGEYTEDVVHMIAYTALIHGLNPITGEVFPYVEKDKDGKIKKISLEFDYRGLQRSARAQAQFHIDIENKNVLSPEEIRERRLHIIPNWEYYRDKNKPPFIEHKPEECIAVEVSLYRLDLYEKLLSMAERAKALGIKPIPVTPTAIGFGVFRPGDSIPNGRSAEWRAETRAIKDAIRRAYDMNFIGLNFHVDPSNPTNMTVTGDDEEPIEQPYIEVVNPPSFGFPGEKLENGKIKYMIKRLKGLGFNPEDLMLQVFGEGLSIEDVTDVMGHNLMELAKRFDLFKDGKVTALQLGYPELLGDALYAAMEQECVEKSREGIKFVDVDTLVKANSEELLEQLPK